MCVWLTDELGHQIGEFGDCDRFREALGFSMTVAAPAFQIENADEFPDLIQFMFILFEQDRADDVAADVEQHAPEQ